MSHGFELSPDVVLPVEAVTETFAIVGKRGSGKSTTAVVMTGRPAPATPSPPTCSSRRCSTWTASVRLLGAGAGPTTDRDP